MRTPRTVMLSLGLAALASACQMTRLEFREPRGSYLDLQGSLNNPKRRVHFPSEKRVEFRQFASYLDEKGAPLTGEIRIDEAIDIERIPPGAERYIIRDKDVTLIRVNGYYWIYKFDQTVDDELTVHYVDILPEQIYALLEGRPITIPGSGRGRHLIYKFQLGIELPPPGTKR